MSSSYTVRHRVAASREQVWDVLADHEGMAGWLPLRRAELEREGSPERDGVGAVRALHLGWPPIRERVTVFEPGHRLGYEAVGGVPARRYAGEVVLTPDGAGTAIAWTVRVRPLVPGTQLAFAGVVRLLAGALVRRVSALPAG
ncbi:SRPBCC family protein [Rhodococcus aerolatus]